MQLAMVVSALRSAAHPDAPGATRYRRIDDAGWRPRLGLESQNSTAGVLHFALQRDRAAGNLAATLPVGVQLRRWAARTY